MYGHETDRPRPALGARMLEECPGLGQRDLLLSCAIGDETGEFLAAERAKLPKRQL